MLSILLNVEIDNGLLCSYAMMYNNCDVPIIISYHIAAVNVEIFAGLNFCGFLPRKFHHEYLVQASYNGVA